MINITHLLNLDVLGTIFGLLATICYVRVNSLAWPIGLVAIICDTILFLQQGIYGDAGLNVIYFGMTFYGWFQWKFGGTNKTELPISNIAFDLAFDLSIITILGVTLLTIFLKLFTNSQVPFIDATTTIVSLIAQYLICRKIIQCWHLWFVVDVLYIGLYLFKGLPAHSLLNLLYLSMAISGYFVWKKQLNIALVEST